MRFFGVAVALLICCTGAACDRGWAAAARNAGSEPVLLRMTFGDTRVFRIQPNATSAILGNLGARPMMQAEVLDAACNVLAEATVPGGLSDFLVVIGPDQRITFSALPPSNAIDPSIPEVRGKCGGLD